MRSLTSFSSICLIAMSLPAQTTSNLVVPKANANVEGNTLEARPFGYDRCRVTQLLGAGALAGQLTNSNQITAVAYRRDGGALPTLGLKRSTSPIWSVRMGNYGPTTSTRTERFLLAGDGKLNTLRTVFYAKAVSFPVLNKPLSGLPGFDVKFPLDSPFVFMGPGLAIDHYVYETRNVTHGYWVDAVRSQVDHGDAKTFGASCPAGKNRAYSMSTNPGSSIPLSFMLYEGPSLSPVIGILGASNTKWGAVALPLGLASLGLPGCSLQVSYDLTFTARTRSEGSAQLDLRLPGLPSLANKTVFFQWLTLDNRVNPGFPIALSNGVQVRMGKDIGQSGLDATMVYRLSNQTNSTVAHVDPGITLVTQITKK